jgi:hypothetical protein
MNSFFNFEITCFSTIYYEIVIQVVNLFRVQPMIIMMIFNMSISYFHKISIHEFGDYLMTKLTVGKVVALPKNTLPIGPAFKLTAAKQPLSSSVQR